MVRSINRPGGAALSKSVSKGGASKPNRIATVATTSHADTHADALQPTCLLQDLAPGSIFPAQSESVQLVKVITFIAV